MADPRKTSRAVPPSHDVEQLIMVINKATHDVLEVARVDAHGQHLPLSESECMQLAGYDAVDEAIRCAEAGFEAGLVEGLGVEDETGDFDDDVLLSRLLLSPSTEHELPEPMRGAMVRRLLLRRLLRSRLANGPTAMEQRRKPIGEHARNGNSTH
jgi:hypothetical protein